MESNFPKYSVAIKVFSEKEQGCPFQTALFLPQILIYFIILSVLKFYSQTQT